MAGTPAVMRLLIGALFVITFCVAGAAPWAQASVGAQGVTPPAADGPVDVWMGIYIVDISDISELRSTFVAELDFIGGWVDPSLAFEGDSPRVFVGPAAETFRQSHWYAQISAVNAVGTPTTASSKHTIFPDGRVEVHVRVNLTLRARFDFRRFPFDSQILPINCESFSWNRDIMTLTPSLEHTGFYPDFDLMEWDIVNVGTIMSEETSMRDALPFSRASFEIEIKRRVGYYIWKGILPMLVIVTLSWIVFWMNEDPLGRRAGVAVTGMLTIIAYMFVVSGTIPRVSYLTVLDEMMVFSLMTIATTLLISLISDRSRQRGGTFGEKLDRTCRWLYPAIYFLAIAVMVVSAHF